MAAILAVFQRRAFERARRRERIFRDRSQPLELGDRDIFRKYRFTRDGCIHVIDSVWPRLEHDTPFVQLTEKKLKKKYRFHKEEVNMICHMLNKEDLDRKTARSKALSKELQVCNALNYFAKGSIFDEIATNHRVDVATERKHDG